jgi:2-polyprenyl-3-methyl-5-hydroxy-6-metoxy-1,4-benzoquinol methylase
MELIHVPCDLCGVDDTRIKMRLRSHLYLPQILNSLSWVGWEPPERWTLVQCQQCGLIYTNPRVKPSDLDRLYPPTMFWDEKTANVRKKDARRWRDQLALLREFKIAGRFLDIGCANGFLVEEAQKAGFDAFGVELSEKAVQYAREVLGLPGVLQGSLEEVGFSEEFFDVITMFDVLEHVPSPRLILNEVVRILRSGGVFIAQLPSVDSLGFRLFGPLWCYTQPAVHLTYFGRRTLTKMMQEAGLTILEIRGPVRRIGIRSEITRKRKLSVHLWRWWRRGENLSDHLRPNPFETISFGGTPDLMVVVGEKE